MYKVRFQKQPQLQEYFHDKYVPARSVKKVAFYDSSFSFLHPTLWTYVAKKFVIQVTITSKGASLAEAKF